MVDRSRSGGIIPPSPEQVAEPAIDAPLASAILASSDSAPKLIPVMYTGMSSSIGFLAKRAPSTVLVSHFSRYPSITNRVRVPGMNISSSQWGIGLKIEKPRMR